MPNIDSIQPVYYQALDPYYVYYDNLPLRNIIARQELINSAVDLQRSVLVEAIGTSGTLSNRLAKSINDDGTLITSAIDDAQHNIAQHTDGVYDDGVSIISYVRMKNDERAKLSLIADMATSLALQVNTISNAILFEDETIELVSSDTITWDVEAPNQLTAHLTFPISAIHNHYYDQTPVDYDVIPDYQTYKVNSLATPYIEGSLRVYINGVRLSESTSVYVPAADGPESNWTLTSFTSVYSSGTFVLSRSITALDVLRIDYDLELS